MKLGMSLPQTPEFALRNDVTETARVAEEIGYDSLWVFERILFPENQSGDHGLYAVPGLPWPDAYRDVADALVTLSLAAAATERIELGTGVLIAPLHLPFRLARTLATLDAASGGRVIAGLGTGWSIDEFAAAAPRPMQERGAALDEFLDIAEAVWATDPVSFKTECFSADNLLVGPKPSRRIPILLAASNRTTMDRLVRRSSGWIGTVGTPEEVGATVRMIRELAVQHGRDPDELSFTFQVATTSFAEVPSKDRAPYAGSIPQLVEDIARLAEAGIDHLFVTVPFATLNQKASLAAAAELYDQVRSAGL